MPADVFPQAPATAPATGVGALDKAYQAGLARVQSDRAAKLVKVNTQYAADLNRLMQELTKAGDPAGALAVKTERDQSLDGKKPTPEQRKTMPNRLLFLRTAYEKNLRPIDADADRMKGVEAQKYFAALEQLKQQAIKAALPEKIREIDAALGRAIMAKGGGELTLAETRQLFQLPDDQWKIVDGALQGQTGNLDKAQTLKTQPLAPGTELRFSMKMMAKWYHLLKIRVDSRYYIYSRGHWANANACFNVNGKEHRLPGKVENPDEWATIAVLVKDGKIQFFYNGKLEAEAALKPMPEGGYTFTPGFNSHECELKIKDVVVAVSGGK